jgi:hypothetical protein
VDEDRRAHLAGVAAGLVLIAVVHDDLHPVDVPFDQSEVVDVPDDLGAVSLVGEARWRGIAARCWLSPRYPAGPSRAASGAIAL